MKYHAYAILTVALSALLSAAAAQPTLKVFILAGQSNMEGKGLPTHLDTYKADPLIKPWYGIVKDGDAWAVRDDVFITYPTKHKGARHGPLTVGYGTKGEDSIGPEFGFGHAVGEAYDEPVLIIKVAWGGKSVYQPFRPPSALPSDAELKQMIVEMQKKYDETIERNKIRQQEGKKTRAPKPVPSFEGTVVFVPTAQHQDKVALEMFKNGVWKQGEEGMAKWKTVGNDRPYHYLGSGKWYFLQGIDFGKAMVELQNWA